MGVELPVLGHLATTQNRVAPPPPDGTKSCAKLPFLSIKNKVLAPPTLQVLASKSWAGATCRNGTLRSQGICGQNREPDGSINLS